MRNCTLLVVALALSSNCFLPVLGKDSIPDRLFRKKKAPIYLTEPHARAREGLVAPPGENQYFFVREDGQPYLLNVDVTVNMTRAVNRFYYDPKWRGEKWVPFDQVSLIERATRMMSTWKEYDEFSQYRKLNGFHKFFERISGYGP